MEMDSSAILTEDEYEHVNEFLFYTPTNIPGKGCDTNLFDWQISFCCSCANGCVNADTCVCIGNTNGNSGTGSGEAGANYKDGRLLDAKLELLTITNFNSNAAAADNGGGGAGYLVECGSRCQCNCKRETDNGSETEATNSKCENRLVQFGPSAGLQIQLFAAKGYGLASTKPLHKGQFICEYAGEVIGEKEAMERRRRVANADTDTDADDGQYRYANANANYIFTLNEYVGDRRISTIVDATCVANIGRYINHSCDPNCSVIPVRVDSLVPRLCIFSLKDIAIGEEITYKYGDSLPHNSLPENVTFGELTTCLCASDSCMKYLPYNAYTSR